MGKTGNTSIVEGKPFGERSLGNLRRRITLTLYRSCAPGLMQPFEVGMC
jgi:hypothetical protein